MSVFCVQRFYGIYFGYSLIKMNKFLLNSFAFLEGGHQFGGKYTIF